MFAALALALFSQLPASAAVTVHAEADRDGVELYRIVDDQEVTRGDLTVKRQFKELVCKLPCDIVLDPNAAGRLFFGGLTVPPSRKLSLVDLKGPASVKVEAGSLNRFVGGYLAMATGVVLLAVGGVAAATGALENGNVRLAGEIKVGLFGVGGGAFLVGGTLFLSGRTTFDLVPTEPPAVK